MKKLLNTLTKFNPASVKVARYHCLFSVLHSPDLYKNYNNSHKDRLILHFTGSPIVNENEISVIFINNDSWIQQYNQYNFSFHHCCPNDLHSGCIYTIFNFGECGCTIFLHTLPLSALYKPTSYGYYYWYWYWYWYSTAATASYY